MIVSGLSATDVRRNWSQFNDDIVREGPQFVKRNRDEWVAMSTEQLKAAFSNFTFHAHLVQEDDGTITATLDQFDLVENGSSEKEVLEALTYELIEYSQEYMENFKLYFQSPNRKAHFPYILSVVAQDHPENVRQLITCQAGVK